MSLFLLALSQTQLAIVVASCVVAALVLVLPHLFMLIFNRISRGVKPTDEDIENAVPYKRVVIFGVDGAGVYWQHDHCKTPNFDRIFKKGSISYSAMSQFPTASGHNWTSILHGAPYFVHGVTNEKAYHISFDNKRHYPNHHRFPSIFRVVSDAHPQATMSSVCTWEAINRGIVESLDKFPLIEGTNEHTLFKCTVGPYYKNMGFSAKECDEEVAQIAIDHGSLAKKGSYKPFDPSALRDDMVSFVCFDYVDHVGDGCRHGTGTPEYIKAVEDADGFLGTMYDAYVAKGWEKDTLFILVTDHGMRYTGGHGHNQKIVRECTVAVAGELGNIIPGTPGKTTTQDVASIALYGLGIKQPDTYLSRVPRGMFNTLKK